MATADDTIKILQAEYDYQKAIYQAPHSAQNRVIDIWGNQALYDIPDLSGASVVAATNKYTTVQQELGVRDANDYLYRTFLGNDLNYRYNDLIQNTLLPFDINTFGSTYNWTVATRQKWLEVYGNDVNRYITDRVNRWYYKQPSSGLSIWNQLFQGPFDPVKFLNPISGSKQLVENFSSPPDTLAREYASSQVDPVAVDPLKKGLEAGVNVVGTVGLAVGVEGFSQGIAGLQTLPSGVEGPVVPSFWGEVASGNFSNAYQIASLEIPSGLAGATNVGTFGKTAETTFLTQFFGTINSALDRTGQGILQILTGNFAGGVNTIFGKEPGTINPGSSFPGGQQVVYAGGGGGGLGYNPNTNIGQTGNGGLVFFGVLIGVVLLIVYFKKRG